MKSSNPWLVLLVVLVIATAGCAQYAPDIEGVSSPTPEPTPISDDWRETGNGTFDNVTQTQRQAAIEREMMEFVNAHRASQGVEPLFYNPAIAQVNRWNSKQMVEKNYFAHESPYTERYHYERLRAAEIDECKVSSETIAYHEDIYQTPTATAAQLVSQFMRSDSHRRALMDEIFDVAGVGVYIGEFDEEGKSFGDEIPRKVFATIVFCERRELSAKLNGWEDAEYRDGTLIMDYERLVQMSASENISDAIRNVSERDENPPFEKPRNWTNPDENRTAKLESDVLPTTRPAGDTAPTHRRRIAQDHDAARREVYRPQSYGG